VSTSARAARARSRPGAGGVRMRRALALAGCGMLSVALGACESTEQESAKIGRESVSPTQTVTHAKHAGHGRSHSRGHQPAVHHAPAHGSGPS